MICNREPACFVDDSDFKNSDLKSEFYSLKIQTLSLNFAIWKFRLQNSDFKNSDFKSEFCDLKIQTSEFRLQNSDFKSEFLEIWKIQTLKFRLAKSENSEFRIQTSENEKKKPGLDYNVMWIHLQMIALQRKK